MMLSCRSGRPSFVGGRGTLASSRDIAEIAPIAAGVLAAFAPAENIPIELELVNASVRSAQLSKPRSSPNARPTVAIVGAGVSGLGIGWRLAAAGCVVDIFDRGAAGRGASWAAAGMLAACAEVEPGEEALFALNRASQRLWPDLALELFDLTGVDVGYRTEGTLIAALTRDELQQLRFTFDIQRRFGLDPVLLTAAETRSREPHLRPSLTGGLFNPEDHQVDNRQLALALRAAFLCAGGSLHEHSPVERIETKAGRVAGIVIDGRLHVADIVVVAAGPWSRLLEGMPEAARPPVRPIKGQMLALQMDPASPLISHVLWAPKLYFVPRNDGRLIIGATVEERGFDTSLTAGGVLSLLDGAWRAVPAIEELPIVEMWTGFRPGSRDDAPILGPGPVEGLVYATGHHRNGILLAPLTADVLSGYILTGELPPVARPFQIDRFAPASTRTEPVPA